MNINVLDNRGWWKVNSTAIYIPATPCKIEHSNITASSTGRSEDGIMRIACVRRDVRKVFLTYKVMTKSELDYMLNLMQGKEFVLTFRDRGQTQTMNAYTGESSYEFYSYALGEELYTDVSINAIEL